jgi:hypothetical protein
MCDAAGGVRATRAAAAPRWRLDYVTLLGGLRVHARLIDSAAAGATDAVLVHGLGVSSRYMLPLARELAPHFRVHAPDLPGFGHGDHPPAPLDVPGLAAALVEWVEAIGLTAPALIGNSMGLPDRRGGPAPRCWSGPCQRSTRCRHQGARRCTGAPAAPRPSPRVSCGRSARTRSPAGWPTERGPRVISDVPAMSHSRV